MKSEDAGCSKGVRNVTVSIVAYLETVPRHSPRNIIVCLNPGIPKRKSHSEIKKKYILNFLCHVMSCHVIQLCGNFPTFRRNVLPHLRQCMTSNSPPPGNIREFVAVGMVPNYRRRLHPIMCEMYPKLQFITDN